jgi:hypothetical protein
LKHVVAGAEEGHIVAIIAEDEILVVAAEEHIGALAAEQRVVARAPVHGQLDDASGQRRSRDAVVAAQGVDHKRIIGPLRVPDIHLSRQTKDGH